MPLGFFFKTLSYLFIDFYYKITIIRFRGKEANDNELPIKIFALKAGGHDSRFQIHQVSHLHVHLYSWYSKLNGTEYFV